MNARGYALLLLLGAMAALSIGGAVVFARVGEATTRWGVDDSRQQLLWLARSAVSQPNGTRTIATRNGVVTIWVTSSGATKTATATTAHETARVHSTTSTWSENFSTDPGDP